MTLVPAYGRDYTSKEQVLAAWNCFRDFVDIDTMRYVNKEDVERLDIHSVWVRYNHLRLKVCVRE